MNTRKFLNVCLGSCTVVLTFWLVWNFRPLSAHDKRMQDQDYLDRVVSTKNKYEAQLIYLHQKELMDSLENQCNIPQ